jgi:ubiquinone biosynthesis protein COQ9
MTDEEFDAALIEAAFAIAAREGWQSVSVISAAREKALPLDKALTRFANKDAILLRFGRLADAHALTDAPSAGPLRERLFDLLMRRFDALQLYRAGVLAVLRALPTDPGAALLLTAATAKSMAWMLEAAGYPPNRLTGPLAVNAVLGVWLYAARAWEKDETQDLSTTMAALDKALNRLEQAAAWLGQHDAAAEPGPKPFPEPPDAGFAAGGIVSGASDTPMPDAGPA